MRRRRIGIEKRILWEQIKYARRRVVIICRMASGLKMEGERRVESKEKARRCAGGKGGYTRGALVGGFGVSLGDDVLLSAPAQRGH